MTPSALLPKKRWEIRAAIAATAATGIFGLPFALMFDEPYPWIMMPGFAAAAGFDGERIEQSTAVFVFHFPDDAKISVAAPVLFGTVPSSNHYALTARFSPVRANRPPREEYLVRAFPHLRAAERSGPPRPDDAEIRAWFREQAARLFPGRDPDAVEVRWQRVNIETDGDQRTIESRRAGWFDL